ncbi:Conserved_hypothetical protein [Hexamita inflata]|uniref:Uncharacterized protein n=1 Tax=Hexamita inflata TaxID=28002 RepID=A0AA86Q9K3_9EUKA|nr:Conserved hypothetical protein [Hexamita inflata]
MKLLQNLNYTYKEVDSYTLLKFQGQINQKKLVISGYSVQSLTFVEQLDIDDLILSFCSNVQFTEVPRNIFKLMCSNCSLQNVDGIQQMKQLTALSLYMNQVNNINALSQLTNLTCLDVSCNDVSDISALGQMVQLKQLGLTDNKITDVSSLSKLVSLQELRLGCNTISDIQPLSSLLNLKYLSLYENSIEDISPLSLLINLTELQLNSNKITSIEHLKSLINLKTLFLCSNQISDVNAISHLSIEKLYLDSNNIIDVSCLQSLTKIKELYLHQNKIVHIHHLKLLTTLTLLNVSKNLITDLSFAVQPEFDPSIFDLLIRGPQLLRPQYYTEQQNTPSQRQIFFSNLLSEITFTNEKKFQTEKNGRKMKSKFKLFEENVGKTVQNANQELIKMTNKVCDLFGLLVQEQQ